MLSPTSQTAVDWQSRSSFPLSLSLFIYLSQLPSMLSLKLIYLLLFSWPIHSHPVILSFSIFFYLNLSVLHISPPVHNSSPDQATFLYHFPSPNMEMEIVIFVYTIKIIEPYLPLFLCIVSFFSQLSNMMGNREENWAEQNKNKLQGCIKIQPITDRVLLFQSIILTL